MMLGMQGCAGGGTLQGEGGPCLNDDQLILPSDLDISTEVIYNMDYACTMDYYPMNSDSSLLMDDSVLKEIMQENEREININTERIIADNAVTAEQNYYAYELVTEYDSAKLVEVETEPSLYEIPEYNPEIKELSQVDIDSVLNDNRSDLDGICDESFSNYYHKTNDVIRKLQPQKIYLDTSEVNIFDDDFIFENNRITEDDFSKTRHHNLNFDTTLNYNENIDANIQTRSFKQINTYEETTNETDDNLIKSNSKNPRRQRPKNAKSKSSKTKPSQTKEKNYEDYTNYVEKILVDQDKLPELLEIDRNSELFRNIKSKCDKCVEPLLKPRVEKHSALHIKTARRNFGCEICEQWFTSEKALKLHQTKHAYIRQCLVCGVRMCGRVLMEHHLRIHTLRVQCTDCTAKFPHRFDFFKHYRAMHSEYICNYCGDVWYTKRHLLRHLMKLHNLSWHCKICNKSFKDYDRHVKVAHTTTATEDAFCVECNRQFSNIHAYRAHINGSPKHNKERFQKLREQRHPCPDCEKVYRSSLALINHHDLVHKRSSRHRCPHCGQQLLTATRLTDHIRVVHLNIKPEKNKICNICGKGFSGQTILTHHMRTHTGDRPFQCGHCDARFAQKSAMRVHVKNIHLQDKLVNRPYQCEYCDARFTQKFTMMGHVKKIHPKDMPN